MPSPGRRYLLIPLCPPTSPPDLPLVPRREGRLGLSDILSSIECVGQDLNLGTTKDSALNAAPLTMLGYPRASSPFDGGYLAFPDWGEARSFGALRGRTPIPYRGHSNSRRPCGPPALKAGAFVRA